jgi:hypothetical protein
MLLVEISQVDSSAVAMLDTNLILLIKKLVSILMNVTHQPLVISNLEIQRLVKILKDLINVSVERDSLLTLLLLVMILMNVCLLNIIFVNLLACLNILIYSEVTTAGKIN